MDRNGWAVYAARNDTMTSHNAFRIAVIAGDGIGREVIPAGMAALEAAVRGSNAAIAFTEFPWGCEHYVKHGRMLDEDGFERLAGFDAIYLGAIGAPAVPDHISVWQLILPLRQRFDQYVNLRPMRLLPSLTSLGAAISGSLGIAPGANINPERRYPSMFEPIHGSAPDIAGKGIANPIGAIWAGALLLDHLGRRDLHDRIVSAIERVVASGKDRTPDLGGSATTKQLAKAITAEI